LGIRRQIVCLLLPLSIAACQNSHDAERIAGAQWWWDAVFVNPPHPEWKPVSVTIRDESLVLTMTGQPEVSRNATLAGLRSTCPKPDSYLWQLVPEGTRTAVSLQGAEQVISFSCPSQLGFADGTGTTVRQELDN
jgi:hypothetical protein